MPTAPLLVVDAGTTALKAALLDPAGRALASASVELPVSHPGPGRAEQHPDDWWRAFVTAVRQCRAAGPPPAALAVTGQMQDLVTLDRAGLPVRPALLYSDLRATAELGALTAKFGGAWSRAIGNVPDPSSTAAQLLWVREHDPESWRAVHGLVFSASGYLLRRAGGRATCDLTTASTTGLLDIEARAWWPPLLEVLGLDVGLLPELVDGVSVVGDLGRAAAEELDLSAGLPLVHAPGDAASVTGGLVGERPGAISISLGTSGWVAALAALAGAVPGGSAPGGAQLIGPHEAIHHLVGPTWRESLLIGALLSAGATVDWARRSYLPGASHADADLAAEQAGPTDLLMLPSLAGERSPVRDPLAVGAVVGLRPDTTPAQLYRAAMEGVGYALRRILTIMGPRLAEVVEYDASRWLPVSGGGARSAVFGQIVADVLGRPVAPVAAEQAGMHGAYRAATAALGGVVPVPLAERTDLSTVLRPGAASEHYGRLADAHAQLWELLRPTFGALGGR
ncbi:MAG TPA: FGGY family carbohydrate kinase [Pseudonocardia sp.]|nr:FGGY family carbohydrate kinase [Pseudonocardia sp.]